MFRKMRRGKQQLSEKECAAVLQEEKRGVLAVNGDEGYPYAVPMDYVYADGRLRFHSAAEGHKIDAINRDPKASFCVLQQAKLSDDGWSYYWNSVTVFGRVRVVREEADRLETLRMLGSKYYPDALTTENTIAQHAARVLVLYMEIEHISGKRVHEK